MVINGQEPEIDVIQGENGQAEPLKQDIDEAVAIPGPRQNNQETYTGHFCFDIMLPTPCGIKTGSAQKMILAF